MNIIDTIFSYYDGAIAALAPSTRFAISLGLLIFFLWQIYLILKRGHWIFVALLLIFLPGTWPAARYVGNVILVIFKNLLVRIQAGL